MCIRKGKKRGVERGAFSLPPPRALLRGGLGNKLVRQTGRRRAHSPTHNQ